MAEKSSTIILKVDLECRRCCKKISKTICKLQVRENIQTIAFDGKSNAMTISGPFEPEKLIKKLCCKAGDVIKDIQVKEKKEKEKPNDTKQTEPRKDKPKETKPAEPTKKDKPKKAEEPKLPAPDPPASKPAEGLGLQPAWTGTGCRCGCRPWWYEGCYGDYKCPWCGRGYGWVPPAGPPAVVYGAPCGGYKPCYFLVEEQPQSSCSVM